ncbi:MULTISPECIES: hypothetical protein [Xanthobacter]|jgi:hypothetical protein|nr:MULTISPECIES: hypothetical protein [unclassified Xanthobacter]
MQPAVPGASAAPFPFLQFPFRRRSLGAMPEFNTTMAQQAEADLASLLDRLKAAQRELVLTAAKGSTLPSDGMLRKISELEGAIAATEALMQEEGVRR